MQRNTLQPCCKCWCCIVFQPEGSLQLPAWQHVFGTPQAHEPADQISWSEQSGANALLTSQLQPSKTSSGINAAQKLNARSFMAWAAPVGVMHKWPTLFFKVYLLLILVFVFIYGFCQEIQAKLLLCFMHSVEGSLNQKMALYDDSRKRF